MNLQNHNRMRTKWIALISGGVLSASLSLSYAATTVPWVDNGVSWTHYYNPDETVNTALYDKLPTDATNTSPVWASGGFAGAPIVEIEENFLRISTEGITDQRNFRQSNGYGLGSTATEFTFEARFRVPSLNEDTSYAGSILFGTGENGRWHEILYSPTTIQGFAVDLTQWTTVRITITGGNTTAPVASVYINNEPDVKATQVLLHSANLPYFQIGDAASGTSRGGVSEWDYIRWTNAGAFAPIPEPGSLALLGIGALVVCHSRRKK